MQPTRHLAYALLSIALGFAVATAAAGCYFFSDFDGLSSGVDDAGTSEDAGACNQVFISTCTSIPHVGPGFTQVVDGDDADFCAVPSNVFNPAKGEFRTCRPPAWLAEAAPAVVARAAWSEEALHVHVRVDKATEILPNDAGALYKGDAVEIFIGNSEEATGDLQADHAAQIIVAPPLMEGEPGFLASANDFSAGEWAARRDGTGYDVELRIPWSFLGGAPPAAGNAVLWNLGVDVASPADERFQSFLHYEDESGATIWCHEDPLPTPSQDDRSWCNPELAP